MPESALAPEHFSDWNEQMVRRYDQQAFGQHPSGVVRWVENKRVNTVIRELQAKPGHRVLDAGCGAGNILARVPGSRFGVDLSNLMTGLAQQRLGQSVTVLRADAEHLPYPEQYFDRVVASSLFSHVLHPEQVAAEIKRVTKVGGRVVISVSDEEQIERGLRWMNALGLHKTFLGEDEGGHDSHGTNDKHDNHGKNEPKAQAFNVEYHLHRFSLKRLREVVGSNLAEIAMLSVPTFIFPVHWIGVYERRS